MYRIQAYNFKDKYFTILKCSTMTERDKIVQDLLTSGNYTRAGITFQWLARAGY